MDIFNHLMQGFGVALTPLNLAWLIGGSILGTVLGMLPGLGPSTGIALLLPLTFGMRPDTALIAMAAIYYGAMFGGSRSSILLNVPGDGAAVASCFDGYPMARNGQAEAALAISAIASFIGGLLATIAFVLVALPVARFALRFGPPEYFCLMIFALAATAAISKEALLKGVIALVLGLMFTTVGLDFQSGVPRFTFGSQELQMGIDFVVVIIGIYGISEVFVNLEHIAQQTVKPVQTKFGKIWVSMAQWKRSIGPILRQTPVGFFVGVLPGAGATIAALMAYNNEKQISKHPEEFGKGAIEGLAAPEAANNACSVGAMIPMMTPACRVRHDRGHVGRAFDPWPAAGSAPFRTAPGYRLGRHCQHVPGEYRLCVHQHPPGGPPGAGPVNPPEGPLPAGRCARLPGVYTINFSLMDFFLLVGLGFVGYLMKKFKVPTAPLILASVVGASMESSFRQSLMLSDGSLGIFFRSGISNTLLVAAVLSLAWPFISDWRARKKRQDSMDIPVE